MTKTWKEILSLAVMGAAAWVAAMLSGQLIVLATGVPASSAVLNGFVVPFLLAMAVRTVRHPWSITLAFSTYGVLAVPTVLLGPPGAHKVVVALLAGLAADLGLRVAQARLRHTAFALAFAIWGALLAALARLAFEIDMLELPGKEQFLKVFWVLTAIFVIEAVAASLAASKLFESRKLDENPSINRLRRWIQQ